jgi:Sigma-70 factor, region 1.2
VTAAGATADPVRDYLGQIGKVPLLNAEQEVELAKRIEAGLFAEEKLASPPGRPDVDGFGRIDAPGRVANRATMTALGWRGGDRLTVTAEAGVMIARRDPGGMVTVPARPYVVIPAVLRRRRGLRAGNHVLLAASPGQDTLAAYSFAVVDHALRAHAPASGEGRRP